MLLHVEERNETQQQQNLLIQIRTIDFTHVGGKDLGFFSPFSFLKSRSDLLPRLALQPGEDGISGLRLTSLTIRETEATFKTCAENLAQLYFLKVQGKSPSKSTFQSLRGALDLLWQITEGWTDTAHLHCSEMAAALTSKGAAPLYKAPISHQKQPQMGRNVHKHRCN